MTLYGAKANKPTAHTIGFKWSIAYGVSEGTLEEPLPFSPCQASSAPAHTCSSFTAPPPKLHLTKSKEQTRLFVPPSLECSGK